MMKLTDSIQGRVVIWLGLLLAVVMAAFGVVVYQLQRKEVFGAVDRQLAARLSELSQAARGGQGPPGPDRMPPDEEWREFFPEPMEGRRDGPMPRGPGGLGPLDPRGNPPADPRGGGPSGESPELRLGTALRERLEADSRMGFVVWGWTGAVRGTNLHELPAIPVREARDTLVRYRDRDPFRDAYHFTELGECVLVSYDVSGEEVAMRGFAWKLMAAAVVLTGLSVGGGWWLVRRALGPLREMSHAAMRLSTGTLNDRLPLGPEGNELTGLGRVLNQTLDRLEAAFERQRQFTADASHELRTPLTLIISEAQATLARERSAGDYREALEQTLAGALRMRELTTSLLELARTEQTDGQGSFDLADCVCAEVDALESVATRAGVHCEVDVVGAMVQGNSVRAGRVVANLVENAIHHSPPGSGIKIGIELLDEWACLTVADQGEGIGGEDLPRVFDRFYRADKARSGVEGRFGLGLAISKAAVEADGGTIGVTSEAGKGATFRACWRRVC